MASPPGVEPTATSSLRIGAFNPDYVAAEMAAFPLASEAALNLSITALDPLLDAPTLRLWRSAENELLANRSAVSLDEAALIRDYVWFTHSPPQPTLSPIPLHEYLRQMTRQLLRVEGSHAVPRVPQSEIRPVEADAASGRRLWMWIQLAMPTDLLLAAAEVDHGVTDLSVRTVSPALSAMLQREGFAETHVHLGAALDFELVWLASLEQVAVNDSPGAEAIFFSPGAALGEGRLFAAWLARASLGRLLVADFLGRRGRGVTVLADHLRRVLAPLDRTDASRIDAAVNELANPQKALDPSRPFSSFAELRKALRCFSPGVAVSADRPFLRDALTYCGRYPQDTLFARVFWQVIRVRSLFYRHLVMRPMARGLQQFVLFFARSRPAKKSIALGAKLDAAMRVAGSGHGVRCVELRLTPEDKLADMRQTFEQMQTFAQREAKVSQREIGLVMHFNRDRGGGWIKGEGAAAEVCSRDALPPGSDRHNRWRHETFYANAVNQSLNLDRCVAGDPTLLRLWRGLDCCTDEQGVPSWVLKPLFRWLRQTCNARAAHIRLPHGRRPMHATVHAGEDFIHLLTGLRTIYESMRAFQLGEGDRIGHALALGIEPSRWCMQAGRLAMAREQRLFDLIWLCEFLQGHRSDYGWRREAADLARIIFSLDDEVDAWHLAQAFYHALHACQLTLSVPDHSHPLTQRLRHPQARGRGSRLERMLDDYLYSNRTHRRARELCWVKPATDSHGVVEAQGKLRQWVAQRGITIEVNPTSNLLIGDLGALDSHPLWRLRPPSGAGGPDDLTLIVGTDDPLILASDLPTEYQRLADAMAEVGLSHVVRNAWFEATIRAGMAHRFTVPV